MYSETNEKGGMAMELTDREALQELLKLLVDHPNIAHRITITIIPSKVPQGPDEQK